MWKVNKVNLKSLRFLYNLLRRSLLSSVCSLNRWWRSSLWSNPKTTDRFVDREENLKQFKQFLIYVQQFSNGREFESQFPQ